MVKNLICLLIMLLSSNTFINAQNYVVKEGNASFKAKMPVNSYTGESGRLQGTIDFETGKVAFTVSVKSIKTGKDKRDGHMYELLKTEKNPNVIFEGKLIDGFDFNKNTAQTVKVNGDFTLAGTTRQITIPVGLKLVSEGTIQLTASWSLLITDYNLERPSLAFIKVKDKHNLSVDVLLREK